MNAESKEMLIQMIEIMESLKPKDLTKELGKNARSHIEKHSDNNMLMITVSLDVNKTVNLLTNVQDVEISQEKRDRFLELTEYIVRTRHKDDENGVKAGILEFKVLSAGCPSEDAMDQVIKEIEEAIAEMHKEGSKLGLAGSA